MKKLYFLATVLFTILLASCSKDNETPEAVNEEELITTLKVTLVPVSEGNTIVLTTRDLDGDGPNEPEVTVSSNLTAGATYNGTIELLDETKSPADNITEEVEEEADEHQFFYTIGSGLDVTATATNLDSEGNLLGTEFELTANTASSGSLTFTLRHEPTKPNDGLSSAGGETDIEASFSITVE
ncbi:type 1 periplasmic binding fold superfamily protein [bacterium]|nr:type 1 periplasmic binding fold superfamily protein [bacterium]